MKYIQVTIGLPLILPINKSGNIKLYVDAAFIVHKDMRSHTGGFTTVGKWGAYVHSRKQKMNTKSSTEDELVGVYDVPNQLIWTRYFLKEQGYMIHDNIVYQDNQSAIKLEKNGRRSRSKRKRHINIRCYFITDRIMKQEVSVNFFPPLTWLGIILQRHYRDLNSVASATSFLVSTRMKFHPTTHPEELFLKNED